MTKWICVALVLLSSGAEAQEFSFIWMNYAQWERLPSDARALYLAGAFDSLAGVADENGGHRVAAHYSKCMSNSGMRLTQFSEHVAAFALTRPDLQGGPMPGMMINYLIALCGSPAN